MGSSIDSAALPRGIASVAVAVVALNMLDAFLTLRHVELGAVELNPLMCYLLQQSALAFVAGKHLMVGAGIVVLAALHRRRSAVRVLRFVVLPLYGGIAVYQLLLFRLAP